MSEREPQQSLCNVTEISQISKARIEQARLAQEVDEFLQLYGFAEVTKEIEPLEEDGSLLVGWVLGSRKEIDTESEPPTLILKVYIDNLEHEWGYDGDMLPPFLHDIRREVSRKRPH